MFDIGWQELFIVAVLAMIVVGPRELPSTLRTVMSYIRKAKSMARDFQNGIDEVAREVELDDIRQEANKIAHMDLDKEIKQAVDPTGSVKESLDMSDVQGAIQDSAKAMNEDPVTTEGAIETAPEKAVEKTPEAIKPPSESTSKASG
ncbi:MAG: twin-arginine translocase subunit TatB [Rhodospirillales bacterium]|nr:twin-arginine translocase subunit TatB [Rhodospirillales bacterium]